MNKLLILVVASFLLATTIQAQPYYFSQRVEAYQEITNDTSVDNGKTWGGVQGVVLPIGFTYNFMGTAFTQLRLETTARLVFDPPTHFYFADGFAAVGIQDRGYTKALNLSPRTYKVEGAVGNRVMKIQIKNAGSAFDTSLYMNFQLWLYEANGDFELHMGPNNITSAAHFTLGPLSGVHRLKSITPLDYLYGLIIYGNTVMPDDSTLSSSGVVFDNYELNGAPIANTVYKYSLHQPTNILEQGEMGKSLFEVHPTPARSTIYADSKVAIKDVVIYTIEGVLVGKYNSFPLNISNLQPGLYCVKVQNEHGDTFVRRIVKQ